MIRQNSFPGKVLGLVSRLSRPPGPAGAELKDD
jgi:hypothetical protein